MPFFLANILYLQSKAYNRYQVSARIIIGT
jgi:hypothetical protein